MRYVIEKQAKLKITSIIDIKYNNIIFENISVISIGIRENGF